MERVAARDRSLVLCEGETDPLYFKTAAELLGLADLAANVDFEWVGQKNLLGTAQGGGITHLDNALKFLVNNPQFITRRIVLLYDCDTKRKAEDHGTLFVRKVAQNANNKITDRGIENLLPETVFEERFYNTKIYRNGANMTTTKELQKVDLCKHICELVRDPTHFVDFTGIVTELRALLLPPLTDANESVSSEISKFP